MSHPYKCSNRWYQERDENVIEVYRKYGLDIAEQHCQLSRSHIITILRTHGVLPESKPRWNF